jgi:hypothetical protein
MQRPLARVATIAARDSWALKGGLAKIARVWERARATADADATWRAGVATLTRASSSRRELDLGDHLGLTVAAPGRLVERLRLDLSLGPKAERYLVTW